MTPAHRAAAEFLLRFDAGLADVVGAIVAGGQRRVLPKGAHVLRPGEVAGEWYYLHRGAARNYLRRGGREVTTWLTLDGDLLTAFASMHARRPSLEGIETLEESTVVAFGAGALRRAYRELPGADRLGRLVTSHYFDRMTTRLHENALGTARDRYTRLLDERPELLGRVPLGIIAGYLGMSPENLSRVRRQLSREARGAAPDAP